MIQLNLTEETKKLHKNYFEKFIKPKLIDWNVAFIKEDLDDFNQKNGKKYKLDTIQQKHNEFIDLCLKKWKTIAIGNVKELKDFHDEISNEIKALIEYKFTFYERDNRNQIKEKGEHKIYRKLLFNKFGYNEFINCSLVNTIIEYGKEKGRIKAKSDGKRFVIKEQERVVHDSMINLLKSIFPQQSSEIISELDKELDIDIFKNKLEKLGEVLDLEITLNNFKSKTFLGIWNAYMFVLISGIRVCPYCNRHYITPIYTSMSQIRGELDHFFPKYKYPYFSMSAYNLIPVCHICNSSLKGKKEFLLDDLNPYEESFDSYAQFSAIIEVDKPIEIKINKIHDKVENYLKMFKLELQYNYHINQVNELIHKKIAYSDKHIDDILKDRFKNSEVTEDSLKEFLIGYTKDRSKINDEPLAKFRRDIVKQLKFLDDSDTDLIEQLKKIVLK
ncbi:hypothetical protein psyc5s11_18780 [Clostridium gelidum]|uniref:HNH domain-containing protein n=1 Tax=Clostridium gelidum TaxID=704125 RepID=A0ABN6IYI9_9CLOT|nr:hypothetical protein [Clostridium gelidum]BCZ45811.1 hypothetical protein psyc5s11_18780 [Clostridium gelidum]